MNVKIYYQTARDRDVRALRDRAGGFIRRGRIESFYTKADGAAALTKDSFQVSESGQAVQLWSRLEYDEDDQAEVGYPRNLAEMPAGLAARGLAAADPYEFFEICGAALGVYRVDVDGEVYWVPPESTSDE